MKVWIEVEHLKALLGAAEASGLASEDQLFDAVFVAEKLIEGAETPELAS